MLEKSPSKFDIHWSDWGNWHPRLSTALLLLFGLMAVGIGASMAIESLLGVTDNPIVKGFGLGAMPLVLGLAALALRESRQNIPLRILLLILGYAVMALLSLFFVAGASAESESPLIENWILAAWGLALLAMTGLLYLPKIRMFQSRFLPIDATDFAHAYASAMGVAIISLSAFSLVPFGEPIIYQIPAEEIVTQTALERNVSLLATAVWSIPAVLLAVGFGRSLNLRESLARLGLQRLTANDLLFPVLLSILLVGVGIGLGNLIELVWGVLGIPVTDAERFAEFAALPTHPLGMLLLGISAGISEEMFVRGVLQPRLGLVYSNLLFTTAHAFQYATDGLLVVLFLGFAFGFIRKRYGLLPAIATHALYNFTLLLFSNFTNIG